MSHLYARSSASDQHPWSLPCLVIPIMSCLSINGCTLNLLPCQWLESSRTRSLALLSIITLFILISFFSLLGCYLRNDLTPVTKPDFCQANHRLPGNGFAWICREQRETPPDFGRLTRRMHKLA